jgi:type VI secretion system secreted protein VgrG
MGKQVNIEVEMEGGKRLSHLVSLSIRQAIQEHHLFELVVPFEILESENDQFFNKSYREVVGKVIKISVKEKEKKEAEGLAFKGIVTSIVLKNNNSFTKFFLLKGHSLDVLLKDGKQRRAFVDQTLSQVIGKVLEPYPQNILKRKIQIENDPRIEYVAQYEESNFDFIKRLCSHYGQWFYSNGNELLIGKSDEDAVDFEVNGVQNFDMSIGLQPLKFEASRYNYIKHESFKGNSEDQELEGVNQMMSFVLSESANVFSQSDHIIPFSDFNDGSELNDYIKLNKTIQIANLIFFNGEGEDVNLRLGKIAAVKGVMFSDNGSSKENFGKYRIVEITHTIDLNGNYYNTFKSIPESLEIPPSNPLPLVGLPEIAEVIDNNDPEKLGRVKVKFFWAAQNCESNWMRVSTPYSAAGKGMIFIPEEGAQVIVGYEFNNPSHPFVLGSLYPKGEGNSYTSDDNKAKLIQTKGGNWISFDDSDGEQVINISNENRTKTFINLSFKDNGSIEIKTEGSLSLEGKEVSITAETFSLKADRTIEIEAGQKAEIKAPQLKINADAKAEMSSNGSLKVSGTTVDLEGQALVNVKGGLIKLN